MTASSTKGGGKSDAKRMNFDPYLTLLIKNSKWIKEFNIRLITIYLLEESIKEKPHDIVFGNEFLGMMPKVLAIEAKIDKLNYVKIKNFYASKDINTVKRRPKERKKYLQTIYLIMG